MRTQLAWTTATVRAIRDLTPAIRQFDLETGTTGHFTPGSHLDVSVQVDGRAQIRSYSIVEAIEGGWRIAVRRADDGRGGSRYLWSLPAGARLSVSEPKNHFELNPRAPQVLLVAGGIGVTPLVAMARQLAARGADVRMAYGARSANDFAYAESLRAALGERLTLLAQDEGRTIDAAALIAPLAPQAECYVCGPLGLLDAMRRAWAAAGRPAANLRYETFGNSGRHAPEAFTVKVPRHGIECVVPVGTSMLEALEQAGMQVLSDCRRGECGLCVVDVMSAQGTIDHRDVFLSDAEKAAGTRMCACVSRVAGGSVTIDSAFRGDPAGIPALDAVWRIKARVAEPG